jgi:CRISPR-associated protein Cas1
VGEAGVRLYAAGQPGGARADRLLLQARLALDDDARLRVVRKMYALRFKEEAPAHRSVDQLRGIEGARVRESVPRARGDEPALPRSGSCRPRCSPRPRG